LIIAFASLAVFICISQYSNKTQNKVLKPNSIDFPKRPNRIVSLAPNLTEILFALGLDKKIIAVSSDSDFPPEAANKKKIGTFWQPNTEAIIAAKPDLVITLSSEQQKAVANSLQRLGYTVSVLKIEKIDDLWSAIQAIGTVTGCKRKANELVEYLKNQVNELKNKYSFANKLKVLWVVQPEPLRVAGRNTFVNELIDMMGGENAVGSTIAQYPQIGSEELLVCGAEVVIQAAMSEANIHQQQKAAEAFWMRYPNLPAVKNNRIYVVNPDIVLRLGPRLPQGLKTIANCLHPTGPVKRDTNSAWNIR